MCPGLTEAATARNSLVPTREHKEAAPFVISRPPVLLFSVFPLWGALSLLAGVNRPQDRSLLHRENEFGKASGPLVSFIYGHCHGAFLF